MKSNKESVEITVIEMLMSFHDSEIDKVTEMINEIHECGKILEHSRIILIARCK